MRAARKFNKDRSLLGIHKFFLRLHATIELALSARTAEMPVNHGATEFTIKTAERDTEACFN